MKKYKLNPASATTLLLPSVSNSSISSPYKNPPYKVYFNLWGGFCTLNIYFSQADHVRILGSYKFLDLQTITSRSPK